LWIVEDMCVCEFVTAGPSTKLFAWGGGDMGGHVLREMTSRGLCGLGCPSRVAMATPWLTSARAQGMWTCGWRAVEQTWFVEG
jgi:hypothetical protein